MIRQSKNWFMLSVRISSYGCTREVWRARKTSFVSALQTFNFVAEMKLRTSFHWTQPCVHKDLVHDSWIGVRYDHALCKNIIFTITAEIHAGSLATFIVNMRTDTLIWNSCGTSASESGQFDNLLSWNWCQFAMRLSCYWPYISS